MMNNATLRKQARQTYWRNRGQLWLIFLILAILSFGLSFAVNALHVQTSLRALIQILFSLALLPITLIGINRIMLHTLHGHKAKFSMLLDAFKPPYHPLKMYAASVLLSIPGMMSVIPGLLTTPTASTAGLDTLSLVLLFLGTLVYIWLVFRMFLFVYLVVLYPQEGLWSMVKTSFRLMRGKFWRLFWFSIIITLPFIILGLLMIVMVVVMVVQYTYTPESAASLSNIFIVISITLSIFYTPYMFLSYAALANEYLPSQEAAIPR